MKFPWHKYEELELQRRNTLQIFITNACNLRCNGCFARKVILENNKHMTLTEYAEIIETFLEKDGKQINLLGGEPLLHPELRKILKINADKHINTTIYTNGYFLHRYNSEDLSGAKLRVSIYSGSGTIKNAMNLPRTDLKFDANFMISASTTLEELLDSSQYIEKNYNCDTFFISSIRELDNPRKEFFDDTPLTMPVLHYKELVHNFLDRYEGNMEIHISKRGVFESTTTLPDTKCRFANQFVRENGAKNGVNEENREKIIQCPYDIVNLKFQSDYEFGKRNCQQNNTCLMSKIVLQRNQDHS
jgi:organic radical activating enzyme